jgi:CRP-like cAMP-binding protein
MIAIMSEPLIAQLSAMPAAERSFGAGVYLFHQGDPVRVLHLILDGAVHLLRRQEDGSSVILQRAHAGSILAEASVFSERYHCDASAVTLTRARLIALPLVRGRIETDPVFAAAWTAYLAHEVQAARMRAEILSLKQVAARLDAWLAWTGGRLPPRGDWRALADELGTSPEALYRELAKRRKAAGVEG